MVLNCGCILFVSYMCICIKNYFDKIVFGRKKCVFDKWKILIWLVKCCMNVVLCFMGCDVLRLKNK